MKIDLTEMTPVVNYACFMRLPKQPSEKFWRTITHFGLVLILDGKFIYSDHENGRTELKQGDLLFIHPYINHMFYKEKGPAFFGCIYHFLCNRQEQVNASLQVSPRPPLVMNKTSSNWLIDRFQQVSKYFYGNSNYRQNMMECLVKEIWLHLFESGGPLPRIPHHLQTMIDYLEENLEKNITRTELSRRFYISPGHINKLFKNNLDKSPTRYLHTLRINRARELLKSRSKTVSEIARELGYYDAFHFSKMFKTETGISPKKYQNSFPS